VDCTDACLVLSPAEATFDAVHAGETPPVRARRPPKYPPVPPASKFHVWTLEGGFKRSLRIAA
jgi:hypothetical protein